ncbi:MAG: hypothetical protein KBA28_02165 [Syntrophaceae bacterium]|nr:hypothetical protein [Syntrophaceae bacterium]
MDREKILRWNPDIICLDAGGRRLIEINKEAKPDKIRPTFLIDIKV